MNIDIGSKIKTLRLSKSMTQEQLAKALHVSAQAVSSEDGPERACRSVTRVGGG